MTDINLPKHIVISGGGFKGFLSLGVLKTIEGLHKHKTILEHIQPKSISGTSIGSLMAVGINLNMKVDSMFEMMKLGFTNNMMEDGNVSCLLHFYGFTNGVKIMDLFQNAVREWFYGTSELEPGQDPTFRDLYDKTHVKLNIVATEVLKGKSVYFNYESFPDMPVYVAMKASVSIPFVFSPVIYEDGVYCDGALLDNSPHNQIINERKDTFTICTDSFIDEIEFPNSFEKYVLRIINLSRNSIHELNRQKNKLEDSNTMILDCKNVTGMNLKPTKDEIESIYQRGKHIKFPEQLKFFKTEIEFILNELINTALGYQTVS